jgi:DNA polymerase-4
MGKIVYLTAPHLPVQVEQQRHLANGEAACIIGGRPWDPSVVLDCSALAQAAGVHPGMGLARAAMRCPDAQFLPADNDAYHAVQQQVDAALRQFTDRVETAGLGAWFVDAGDMARMFAEDERLAQHMLKAARDQSGLQLQLGLASHRFTAQQAAYAAAPNSRVVVPPKHDRAFLSPLPLTKLPIDDELLRRLDMLGIHSLGALAALPRLALIRQFGAFAGILHDLAAGRDPRPVYPEAPPLELRQSHVFEPATAAISRLHTRTEAMSKVLAQTLKQQGYQAQGIRVQLEDETNQRHAASGVVKPPTADSAQLHRRITALMNRLNPAEAVESVTLVIYPLRPAYLAATQLAMFTAVQDQQQTQLQQVLQRLRERFGQLIIVIASLIGPPRPQKIQVTTGPDTIPRALVWPDRIVPVRSIYEHWRESRFWWAQPVQHYYYRVEDNKGQVRVVYHDLRGETWWLDRRTWNTRL